jgi:UDP-3-O-[3-hydroxymyristoyl] glucosamine N-acyltransferase
VTGRDLAAAARLALPSIGAPPTPPQLAALQQLTAILSTAANGETRREEADVTDATFFKAQTSLTVAEIATLTGATPRPGAALERRITNVAPIDAAGPQDLTFLDNVKFADALASTRAGAILTSARYEARAPAALTVLCAPEPYPAFVRVMREFYRDALRPASPYQSEGIAAGATVHPTARLGDGVTVDPGAVIGPQAEIGAGSIIGANAVIGARVRIGRDCSIGPTCTISHAQIGDRVIIHPGCQIGQDGFGYVPSAQGHVKVPQVGAVVLHDDVEIGAGSKIDRGGMRDTVVGQGTKIDNLVQIGHNVVIGRHCIIVAQSGLSGSVTIEDFALLGARTGIIPHITVGKGAQLASRSTVYDDVPAGARWGGFPARPMRQWTRAIVTLDRLAARSGKGDSPAAGAPQAEPAGAP